jgi:hypothetical protein
MSEIAYKLNVYEIETVPRLMLHEMLNLACHLVSNQFLFAILPTQGPTCPQPFTPGLRLLSVQSMFFLFDSGLSLILS